MSDHAPKDPAKLKRLKRLEQAMRENLKRRKLQERARGPSPTTAPGQHEDDAAEDQPDEPSRPDSAPSHR